MSRIPKKSLRILLKAALLFLIFNFAFVLVPDSVLWKLTIFNTILPGRARFKLENDLDFLFNTHEIASSPKRDETVVVVLGDSSTWGVLLTQEQTFSGLLNTSNLTCNNRPVHIYNLGYPKLSVFKDLILLQRALAYKPDLIIWSITLNSVLKESKQHPLVDDNHALAQALIDRYHLSIELGPPPSTSLFDQTFFERRSEIARFIKYQLDGIRWEAAGEQSEEYKPIGQKVSADNTFGGLYPPTLDPNIIQFDVLNAGIVLAGNTPLVIVNEPIQIVTGKNSEIRYNRNYPRWAYDQYRAMLAVQSSQKHWNYADLWNILPPTEFTDSVIHRTPAGEQVFAQAVKEIILQNICP